MAVSGYDDTDNTGLDDDEKGDITIRDVMGKTHTEPQKDYVGIPDAIGGKLFPLTRAI